MDDLKKMSEHSEKSHQLRLRIIHSDERWSFWALSMEDQYRLLEERLREEEGIDP